MINTSGTTIAIVDSDALIGLARDDDALHQQCIAISQYLEEQNIETFIPYAVVLEAATMLARVINRGDLASKLLQDYEPIDEDIDIEVFDAVAKLYAKKSSKKNTPFDHYVLALAKKNNIQYIFSFDSFYKKRGLTLIEDLLP